ncbi:Pfs domain protein [Aspergillus vadensis CBS 113365]|uniref:Purine and uridine phosphorylase n=1 Tax=Aspergillus vadensis (strain CBS 113365 / IMI 142717 / IBT 24658) TaxID=1448311 RepID=A0A319AY39_ASPVC|nr:purine and uridine phosphorylase [Aspergillus vadensis CBS 113365]PYH64695.1 purine and uridine phosphorylase [Aspergillus vadensis CBS 113365]
MPRNSSKSDVHTLHQQGHKITPRHDEYTVGWICNLPMEMTVASMMLDAIHSASPIPLDDSSGYILGRIRYHNIVIACLPNEPYDSTTFAVLERQVFSNFSSIRFYLSVGTGSGIPSSKADIRLGDIVVSQPRGKSGGLIRYDFGRVLSRDEFSRTESLNQVPEILSAALAVIQADHDFKGLMRGHVAKYLCDMQEKLPPGAAKRFARPDEDYLFQADYEHFGFNSCADCDRSKLILRPDREHEEPAIHYGSIATGSRVMKHGQLRDRIDQELGILCFDSQAARLMDNLPCLAIRGICDYADSHKDKAWQGYAAAAAAAYAKELLLIVPAPKRILSASISVRMLSPIDQARSADTSGYSSPKPGLSQQRESTLNGPPTDSGYASITHQKISGRDEYRTEHVQDDQGIVPGEEGFPSPPAAASPRKAKDDHSEDTKSIYTTESSISPSDKQIYISELVNDLFRKAQYDQDTRNLRERIHGVLPQLLKAFAMKFGQLGSTPIHRDIMWPDSEIANGLKMKYLEDQTEIYVSTHDDTKMELGDLMALWDQHLEDAGDDLAVPQFDSGAVNSDVDEDIPIEDGDENIPEHTKYWDLITASPVYEWLIGSLRRKLHLHPAEPNVQDVIRDRILEILPSSRRVSRYDQPTVYQVVFLLSWDPASFIAEQEYDLSEEGFLGKIITITGSSQDAQAMTCLQYLQQTWHSYGADILELVEATLRSERDYKHSCTLPDNTRLAAWTNEKEFLVEVTGIESSITEIGEQLAWLGSALRSSPHESRILYCTPVKGASNPNPQAAAITRVLCCIEFKCEDQEQTSSSSPLGQCWHHLFRNPTVVMGFPVPYRSRQNTGLEIPLNILAGLAQATQVDAFSDKLFIKGFSSLLIPTEYIRDQDQMMWHLRYNVHGDRISYLDGIGAHVGHITLVDMESSRHILGWCSDAKFYAGAADASYSINRSWLGSPSSRCSLSNTSITAGRLITGGDPAMYGNKDIPYRLTRDEYIEKLSWIARQYVVMWDVGAKRGWLVNGACALLHLLFASLHFNKTDPLGFAFQLDPTDIKFPENTFAPRSAMEVLLNPDNLCLKLYNAKQSEPNETTLPPVRIQHRVDRLYNMLEKIMDHQAEIMGTDGGASRNMARGNLEGWDFKDLATQEDPLCPRLCKLSIRGKCWVDFTRDIRASVLFGTGFGEILRPVDNEQLCPYWSRLPEGESYLAVSGYDLANIIDRFGNPHSKPIRLTRNLVWCNCLDNGRPACRCIGLPEQTEHSELAQVILPSHFRRSIPKHNSVRPSGWSHGAIVFGYNRDLRWTWNDTGYPEQKEVLSCSDDSGSDSDGDFHDSGLGTSLAPVTAHGSRRLSLSRSPPEGITHEDYEVGIVCALSKELLAVRALFDSTHPDLEKDRNDPNCYCLGRMKGFNVVAAGLPYDDYGTNSATNVASHLIRTFPRVKFCLVVGIGGGVPSTNRDIRLGDVVVGTGVLQGDMGKWIQNSEFKMTAQKQQPPPYLRAVITKIQSNGFISFESALNPLLDDLDLIASMQPKYLYPGADKDMLFDAGDVHVETEPNCDKCIGSRRPRTRQHDGPSVFYGLIASGNQLVRDARYRDRLGQENVICVEMEAAGVMRTTTDCLVIRGICDYADSHKNDQWQEYAAASAAAYAKFFLSHMRESAHEFAVRVPSRLEAPTGSVHLQKEKRAASCAVYDQHVELKRSRRY